MSILLDTHTFIWWYAIPSRLSQPASASLNNPQQMRYLSAVSVWEMQIKIQTGKLSILPSLQTVVQQHLEAGQVQLLPLKLEHIFTLNHLPTLPDHRDPFDRLLVAQALYEKLPMLSGDPLIAQYPIQIIW